MPIELSTYLTANAYKALVVQCGYNIESIMPSLSICEAGGATIFRVNGEVKVQCIDFHYYDKDMQPINLKSAKINLLSKGITLAKMRKQMKSTVLIEFGK